MKRKTLKERATADIRRINGFKKTAVDAFVWEYEHKIWLAGYKRGQKEHTGWA